MTKKDYELIAGVLAESMADAELNTGTYKTAAVNAVWSLSLDMADTLAADSPRFDRERFLTACGVE